ncbi:MAG: NUDIX hydrolase [Candidatus Saccharimonas sp.]
MSEEIFAKGKIFELVHVTQDDGRVFEVARRAPGVRVIIEDKLAGKLLLTKEFRHELGTWDYRLPGGKVFDTLSEYEAFRATGDDIVEAAKCKAVAEAREEAGVAVTNIEYIDTSTLGATVEWDLYVFHADGRSDDTTVRELEAGERIEENAWVTYDEAKQMILNGVMQEGRVALTLLQWLSTRDGGV